MPKVPIGLDATVDLNGFRATWLARSPYPRFIAVFGLLEGCAVSFLMLSVSVVSLLHLLQLGVTPLPAMLLAVASLLPVVTALAFPPVWDALTTREVSVHATLDQTSIDGVGVQTATISDIEADSDALRILAGGESYELPLSGAPRPYARFIEAQLRAVVEGADGTGSSALVPEELHALREGSNARKRSTSTAE